MKYSYEIKELLQEALDKVAQCDSNKEPVRIMSLMDFVNEKYKGNQRQCAIANDMAASQLGAMLAVDNNGNEKFIMVGERLYRLAKVEFK